MPFQNSRVYYLAAVSGLGGATLGYDTGIGGGVIALPSFQKAFYGGALKPSAIADLSSNVVSVLFGGAFLGSLLAAPLTTYIGRRYALMVSCVIFIGGAMIQIAHTSNIGYIYGGRSVAGIGIGMFSNICPVYVGECAPKEIRGRLAGIFQQALVIGGLIAYFLTYGVARHWPSENKQWRLALGLQAFPAGLMLIGLLFTVDSPRYLAEKNRDKDGLRNLAYLRKRDINDPIVRAEYAEICAQRDENLEHRPTFKQLLLPGNRIRLMAGVGVSIFYIWCGHNSILYYGPTVFQSIGYTSASSALLATGIFTVIKVCCTVIFLFFADHFGRRTSLLVGSAGQAITLFILGGILSKNPASVAAGTPPGPGHAMVAMIYLFIIIYSFSWGPLSWVLFSEIFPPKLRQIGMATCMTVTWVFNYALSKVTPIALTQIGWRFWIILACINCSGLLIFFFPETKGVSLENIDLLFSAADTLIDGRDLEKVEETITVSKAI